MKKKGFSGKKAVAVGSAVVMLASSSFNFPVASAADTTSNIQVKLEQLDSTYGKSTLDKLREKLDTNAQTKYKDSDMVSVIVELKEKSLLDNYTASNSNVSASKAKTFEKYMETSKARSAARKIQKEQNSTISSIEKTVDDDSELTVLYQYSTVMNGFAVRVKYGELKNIKELSNVKAAYVAPVFDRPEPIDDKQMSSSGKMIHADTTWDLNLKGEDTVVAILDTGLDTKHDAFQTAPSKTRVTSDMVQSVIDTKTLNADITKASSVYVNEKVPYAYDYADVDPDVNPTDKSLANGNSHGTHVAGTVAAKSTEVTGVAPEAQLMVMKVFPDASSGAATEDIVAALDDAVELGADVINMSLGSDSGFTEEGEESVSKIYDRITEAGVSLSVSAGNSNSLSENNARNGSALASNPDTAVVGSPSTYSASTSVASVINNVLHSSYFELAGKKVTYDESAKGSEPRLSKFADQTVDYVVVPKNGEVKDYEGIDVKGKVALVTRGGITFTEKVQNAAANGATAVIICNNQAGTISMSIEADAYTIPAVSITKVDGEDLKAAKTKKLDIKAGVLQTDLSEGTQMSDFSSWGVSPNLDLKPEIAAPGGHIYSTLPFNTYGDMSGTSMAAPHISGTYALVKEYIKSQSAFSGLTNEEIGKLATQLLMSTSNPTKNASGVLYAPRQQGSGIVNVYNAVSTKAYLYTDTAVEENNKPKLNLYDDVNKTGKFTQSFHIKNISDKAVTYKINNTSLAEIVKNADGELVLAETEKDVSNQVAMDVAVTDAGFNNGEITVNGGKDAQVTVTFTMNDELKNYYDANLANGGFFEGFVQLDGDGADLSIPYLGFYGDWTKAPLFDAGSVYDYNEYSQAPHAALSDKEYLGVNLFDDLTGELIYNSLSPFLYGEYYAQALKPDVNKIAISPNSDGIADSLKYMQLGLLRNAKALTYEIKDENNNVVKSGESKYERKSTYYNTAVMPTELEVNFTGKDKSGKVLANNSVYTVTVKGDIDYDKHASNNVNNTISIPVTIDTEAPSVLDAVLGSKDGKTYLTVKASDNQFLSCVEVGTVEDGKRVAIHKKVVNEETKNAVTDMQFDVTEAYKKSGKDTKFYIDTYDYAFNEAVFGLLIVEVPVETPTAAPTTKPTTAPTTKPTTKPTTAPTTKPTTKPVTKPGKVTGVTAKAQETNSVTLSWKKQNGVSGYDVYAYNAAKKSYVKVAAANAKTNSAKVTKISGKKLTAATNYSFKVRAYKTVNGKKVTGEYSNVFTTATRPSKTTLSVKAKTRKAQLSWKKVSGVNGYEVFVSTKKSSGFKKVKTITNKSTVKYTKTGLRKNKTYYFKVRSYKTVNGKKIYSSCSTVKAARIR